VNHLTRLRQGAFLTALIAIPLLTPLVPVEVLAQGVTTPSAAPQTSLLATGDSTRFFSNTLMFMVVGFFGYYLLVTRPMVQKEDESKKFLESLKKNDSVVISSGILGKVAQIDGDEVTVDVGNGVKFKVLAKSLQGPDVAKTPTKKS